MADQPRMPARLVELAQQRSSYLPVGRHRFTACRVCGAVTLAESVERRTGQPAVVCSIDWLTPDDHPCFECIEAHNAAPRVVDWVLSVLRLRDEVRGG